MKAAVIHQRGDMPTYTEIFPAPTVQGENEVLVSVQAAAIKHFDKSRASGKHYSATSDVSEAKVIGGDCVGKLEDGTRVFALGVNGTIAEKTVIEKSRMVKLPEGLDDAIAAALPNAIAGSAMALRFKAKITKGETVLINGATGFTGRTAVQIARYYGAAKIIVTGRNKQSLESLKALGADECISVSQPDGDFIARIKTLHENSPIDIIIDYLWGHTAELILESLKGRGSFTHKTRFVSVGAITGDVINLSAENLRSVDLQLSGSGLGSWTKDEVRNLFDEILPEMFKLAAENKLKADIVRVELKNIEKLWEFEVVGGSRLVIIIN